MNLDHPLWIISFFVTGIVLITITRKQIFDKNDRSKRLLQKMLFSIGALLLLIALFVVVSGVTNNF